MNISDIFSKNYFKHNYHLSQEQRFLHSFLERYLLRMERYIETVSIIIQGKLNKRSIDTIPEYLKYGEVIISCWDNDDLSMLDKYKDKVKIIINKYSNAKTKQKKTGSQAPWIFQNLTTLNGLNAASGYLCIKLRSDESYPILDPLINKFKNNRDTKDPSTNLYKDYKIITSNIYFRHDRENKFHPSDHIIAGTKSRMLESFELSNSYCYKPHTKFPEQLIAHAIINSYFDPVNKRRDRVKNENSKELMKKHFDIIRIKDLPNHIWTSSYRKYDPLYSEEDWCHDINSI